MLELRFEPEGVTLCTHSALPRITLRVAARTVPEGRGVLGLTLHTLVQIECAARGYDAREQERLRELFGQATQWPQTLRSVLWTRVTTHTGAFVGAQEIELELPCGAELELVANKYFFGVEAGEVPLRLLFSGSVLHGAERVQVAPLALTHELVLPLPVRLVREAVERHHAERMLLGVRRDVFERVYRYRREHGLATWEHTLERLLQNATESERST